MPPPQGGTPGNTQTLATHCPLGYSTSRDGTRCLPDACDVNLIKPPRHGSMGNCATREFEFLHTRPNPIDDTDVTIASMEGALGEIGIPFSDWSADEEFTWNDGAVFWSDPEDPRVPTGSATVAQITVPTGSEFHAVLSFQGKTTRGYDCRRMVQFDEDEDDACSEDGGSWQEDAVHFSNVDEHLYRNYEWLTPQVLTVQRESVPGYTTYRLVVVLAEHARNIYAVFGDRAHPAVLPASYQEPTPFGADIGGTHATFWDISPSSRYDSFVTLGDIDMEHPDIIDNMRMLASGTACDLACDAGYVIEGDQPSCFAGAVTNSAVCRSANSVRETPTIGDEDLSLYAPEPAAGTSAGARPGRPGRPQRPVPPPRHNDPVPTPAVQMSPPETAAQQTQSAIGLNLPLIAGAAAAGILVALVARRACRRSSALDTPPEAVAACKTESGLPSSAQAPGEFGKVETTENNLFGGFSLVQ